MVILLICDQCGKSQDWDAWLCLPIRTLPPFWRFWTLYIQLTPLPFHPNGAWALSLSAIKSRRDKWWQRWDYSILNCDILDVYRAQYKAVRSKTMACEGGMCVDTRQRGIQDFAKKYICLSLRLYAYYVKLYLKN